MGEENYDSILKCLIRDREGLEKSMTYIDSRKLELKEEWEAVNNAIEDMIKRKDELIGN